MYGRNVFIRTKRLLLLKDFHLFTILHISKFCERNIIAEEDNILKKLEKLERKLQRCSTSLAEMQRKIELNFEDDGDETN